MCLCTNVNLQLTNETLEFHVKTLSEIVKQSQEREVDHQEQNLDKIAGIFSSIANHVVGLNTILDMNVLVA